MPARSCLDPHAARWVLLLAACASSASAEVRYNIDLAEATAGWLSVEVAFTCEAEPCELRMPVWSATYQVRDFAQYVPGVAAETANGRPARVRKLAPSRWSIAGRRGQDLVVRYRVSADRPGPFGAYVDAREATLNLAQVLLYPADAADEEWSLAFRNQPEGFRQALALDEVEGRYRAASYSELVDTPVHLSRFSEAGFHHDGKLIRVVAAGVDAARRLDDLERLAEKIVAAAARLMGGLPFDSYTFVYVFNDLGGGGMEYRNGCVIFAPADCGNCGLPSLSAHEFFHLWNVKRIRPASLEPVDFSRPQPTPSLWFSEGVTSTYAQFLMASAGLLGPAELMAHIEQLITDFESRPAATRQSAEESSIEAWFERYPSYARADRSVSYYLKGELIGYLLDLEIRRLTRNARSLDDVLRLLDEEYGRPGRAFADSEALERAVSQVAQADAGPLFDLLVRSPAPVPWNRFLSAAGLALRVEEDQRPTAGLMFAAPPGEDVVIAGIAAGGPAEAAGLRVGDLIRSLDGRRLGGGPGEALRRLAKAVGHRIEVEYERGGEVRRAWIAPRLEPSRTFRIEELPRPTELERAILEGWLTRSAPPSAPDLSGRRASPERAESSL